MAASQLMGLDGSFFGKTNQRNCVWCDVRVKDMWKLTKRGKLRTLEDLFRMTHTPSGPGDFPFECPGCHAVFPDQASVDAEQPPTNPVKFRHRHKGLKWHHPPLLRVALRNVIMCTLHMRLSVTARIWKIGIVPYVKDEVTAQRVNKLLEKHSVYAGTVNPVSTTAFQDVIRTVSFTGRESLAVLENIIDFLRLVHSLPDTFSIPGPCLRKAAKTLTVQIEESDIESTTDTEKEQAREAARKEAARLRRAASRSSGRSRTASVDPEHQRLRRPGSSTPLRTAVAPPPVPSGRQLATDW